MTACQPTNLYQLSSILTGPTCNLVLGIQQMIVLAQLSVGEVLDQLDPQQ
ncbi:MULTISPECIES: hypothetical protein [unclassified Pseudomonas]|jgi:hypothetical protein|nr:MULTISPECIES: hypothetical protein [unclassified Pseudomonas]